MRWLRLLVVTLLLSKVAGSEVTGWSDHAIGNPIEAFQQWFDFVGGKAPGLEVFHTGTTKGYGVRTSREIHEGDEIITIPKSMIFSRNAALDKNVQRERGFNPDVRNALARTTYDDDVLALLLLRERARGEESYFAPWLNLLPVKAVTTPSVLSPNQMRWMLDEPTFWRAKPLGKRRSDRYHRIKEQIRVMVAGSAQETELATLEAFVWADSIVSSRAIKTKKEGKILAPFLDMLNHAPHPQARKRNHAKLFDQSHEMIGNIFMVTSDRHTFSKEEVFVDYGEHDSEYFYHMSAFVPDVNPFDCLTVRLEPPDLLHKARPLIRLLNVPLNPEGCLRPGRPLPDKLLYHLHMLSLPEEAAVACVELVTADPEAGALPCFDETYTVETAWKKLQEILAQELKTPKKTPPQGWNDANVMSIFIPQPAEVQPGIDMYEASRNTFKRILLDSPAPPETAEEGEPDFSFEAHSGAADSHVGLQAFIDRHSHNLIGQLRRAKQKLEVLPEKDNPEDLKKCGVGLRRFGPTENRWNPAAAAKAPPKEQEPVEEPSFPEPVHAKLLELRAEIGKILADPMAICSANG